MRRVLEFENAYGKILLGVPPVISPGVVKLSGHDRNKKWDIKSAKGQAGATTTLQGDDPAQFTATFYLAGDDEDGSSELDEWGAFQALIEATTNGPKPVALPIYHPDLVRNRITEVVNAGVSGMVHDGKGGATVTVKFIEYKPPKKKPAAKPQAKPGAAPNAKPDPNAAAKRELAALLEEARKP